MATIHTAEVHTGTNSWAIGRKEFKIKFPIVGLAMKKSNQTSDIFRAGCINNKKSEASLEIGKL